MSHPTDPDDLEIKIVTPDDAAAVIIIGRDGEVTVQVDPSALPPEVFCKLLLDIILGVSRQEGLTFDQIKNAPVETTIVDDEDEG